MTGASAGPGAGASDAALLIVDLLSDLAFPEADAMIPAVIAAARVVRRLRDAADAVGVPVVYANDSLGIAPCDLGAGSLVERVGHAGAAARTLVALIAPRPHDEVMIKPQFSGFFSTDLRERLARRGIRRLIVTGTAADICVLFTAADAHMHGFALWVPADAVAGLTAARTRWALDVMAQAMSAQTAPSDRLSLGAWLAGDDEGGTPTRENG